MMHGQQNVKCFME